MSVFPLEEHVTGNIDEHMALVGQQCRKSRVDPEIRQLAVKIVSAQYEWIKHPRTGKNIPVIKAWDQTFHAPQKVRCKAEDAECEIKAMWEFMNLNLRYVYDPADADFFATARATLEAGGGDCDDMVITADGLFTNIGFEVVARVISVKGEPDDWVHTYPMIGLPKDGAEEWVPFDLTVAESYPGWQYPGMARHRDYRL